MRRLITRWVVLSVVVAAGAALAAGPKPASPASPVKATLELNRQFYYVGDPLQVRVTISNTGDAEATNPVKGGLIPAFQVLGGDGRPIAARGKADGQEPQRPTKLAAKTGYFGIVDLVPAYPELKSPGTFTIRWSADGLGTEDVIVHMIPRFDPAKEYAARVETEEGSFVIDLLKKTSPVAVKAFVDMANSGFYDGLKFHEIHPEQLVAGGDPTGTGTGQGPIRFPAELSAVPIVAGTVIFTPAGPTPPSNGSQFKVFLRPQPQWIGQFTVLGQVVEGLEVVKRISNLPSSDKPSYRPLKDVHTVRVSIIEKPSSGTAPAAGS